MVPNQTNNKRSAHISIIETVQTPLGFFTLVVLVVEVVLGITANLSQGADRTYLVVGMLALIFLLVIIVAVFAVLRPEALSGMRPLASRGVTDLSREMSSTGEVQFGKPTVPGTSELVGPHRVYSSIDEATPDIVQACKVAESIKIMANKGIRFIGTDESLVSTADIAAYQNLRKVRVILMGHQSRWISKGFIALRRHESLETYLKDLDASHQIVQSGVRKFETQLPSTRSGVKYFTGEPSWRIVMTESTVFVSNYADENRPQVRDLPVAQFNNTDGSFYSAFKRHFDNIWHNESMPSEYMQSTIDFEVSAGGIVYAEVGGRLNVLLLKRHDGHWVLPKGHKQFSDTSIETTALREVSEETGIPMASLQVERELEVYTETTFGHKVVHLFAIKYRGTQLPKADPDVDHAEARWWPIALGIPHTEMLYPYQASTLSEFIDDQSSKLAKNARG